MQLAVKQFLTLANTVDSEDKTQVYIDGAYQSKGGYTVSGTTLTFDTGIPISSEVEVMTFSTATANNAASAVKLDTFTGDGSELEFELSEAVVDEKVTQVYINGVYQNKSTYSIAADLVTLTFGSGNAPPNSSAIEVISFKTITSTDGTLTATTFFGDLNGTINTATTATTQTVGDNTTKVATTAFVKTGLDLKANIASPTFTGTVAGITKAMVGLTNAEDTSDADKPVSTAGQTALDLKANIAGPTFTGDTGAANLTLSGYLRGPASFVIDPAAHGDDTGTLVVAGNLQVDGTTTTINSTTVSIDDLNFSIATDAADSAAANGAGITIGGAGASLTYSHSGTKFVLNKPLDVTGAGTFSGSVTANTTSAPTLIVGRDGTDGDVIQIYNGATGTTKALYLGVSVNDGTIGSQYGDLLLQPSNGNVGIGTTSPVKTLDVQGQLAISNNATSYWYLDRNDSSGNLDFLNYGDSTVKFSLAQTGAATFSGALNGTSASFTGNVTVNGNDFDLNNNSVLHRITNDNTNLLIRADYTNSAANSTIQFSIDGNSPALTLASTGAATFSGAIYGTSALFGSDFLANETSKVGISFGSGYGQINAWGANTSTYGGLKFQLSTSNGNTFNPLIIEPTGAATFSSSLKAEGIINYDEVCEKVFTGVAFTNLQSNKAVDIILGNIGIWGYVKVEITSSYNYQNSSGKLTKLFSLGTVAGGSIYSNESRVSDAMGTIVNNIAIGNLYWDTTTSTYRIPISHIVSSGNAFTIKVNIFSVNDAARGVFDAMTISSVYDLTALPRAYVYYNSDVGIGTTSPAYKLDVNGTARVSESLYIDPLPGGNLWNLLSYSNGDLYLQKTGGTVNLGVFNGTNGIYNALSDANKKKDFEQSQIGIDAVLGLKPTLYRFKDSKEDSTKELGFIAQEVKEYIPQAYVESGTDDNKFIGLNQIPIIAALTKAIQEQQTIIEELKSRIEILEG